MDKRYEACTLTDLAYNAGVDVRTLQNYLDAPHLIKMIELGWNPWRRKLMPRVVRYILTEIIDKPTFNDDTL
jgi:hypothetical protein